VWAAHLGTLQAQLPHIRAAEQALITPIELKGKSFRTETQPQTQEGTERIRSSMAAGQYIDRYLRGSDR
jgi:hypothetical protein